MEKVESMLERVMRVMEKVMMKTEKKKHCKFSSHIFNSGMFELLEYLVYMVILKWCLSIPLPSRVLSIYICMSCMYIVSSSIYYYQ